MPIFETKSKTRMISAHNRVTALNTEQQLLFVLFKINCCAEFCERLRQRISWIKQTIIYLSRREHSSLRDWSVYLSIIYLSSVYGVIGRALLEDKTEGADFLFSFTYSSLFIYLLLYIPLHFSFTFSSSFSLLLPLPFHFLFTSSLFLNLSLPFFFNFFSLYRFPSTSPSLLDYCHFCFNGRALLEDNTGGADSNRLSIHLGENTAVWEIGLSIYQSIYLSIYCFSGRALFEDKLTQSEYLSI